LRRSGLSLRAVQAMGREILTALGFPGGELAVLLCDDARIRELNRQHRGKDRATDVLSFSQIEGDPVPNAGRPTHLGDVVISLETAARQADQRRVPLRDEAARLLIHGTLHLLGHDHVHGGRQAAKMTGEERRLWRRVRAGW